MAKTHQETEELAAKLILEARKDNKGIISKLKRILDECPSTTFLLAMLARAVEDHEDYVGAALIDAFAGEFADHEAEDL